jgi:RNA recognition motif-containing protein
MSYRLYIGNLPFSLTDLELAEIFTVNGFSPTRPHILVDKDTGRPRGFGFVDLVSREECDEAIKLLDGSQVGGRAIKVSIAIEKQKNRSQATQPEPPPSGGRNQRGRFRKDSSDDYNDAWSER